QQSLHRYRSSPTSPPAPSTACATRRSSPPSCQSTYPATPHNPYQTALETHANSTQSPAPSSSTLQTSAPSPAAHRSPTAPRCNRKSSPPASNSPAPAPDTSETQIPDPSPSLAAVFYREPLPPPLASAGSPT